MAHAVSVLKPGGLLFIHEFILNDDRTGPLFPALFSINMLLGTPTGQSYSERELKGILERNGVVDIKRLDVKSAGDVGDRVREGEGMSGCREDMRSAVRDSNFQM